MSSPKRNTDKKKVDYHEPSKEQQSLLPAKRDTNVIGNLH